MIGFSGTKSGQLGAFPIESLQLSHSCVSDLIVELR